jgi:flagellar motility protein MotE (MotC chaperone)
MAPEVRSLPPLGLALALALALPVFPTPSYSQQTKPSAPKETAPEGKARLLQELDRQIEERRRELARQGEELAALKRALEAAKVELLQERQRMEELKAQVEADLGRRGKASDERVGQVAKVYQAMKPKEAALALEKMDDDLAVAILDRLPGRTVGKLFDLMDKNRVRQLTRRLQEGRGPPVRGEK